ncbi:MAG: hypothetical protein Q8Q59_10095 [Luteolibacter sp.]|jgi:hypothetical protein|nr:hypothetical protein [Luteolibacter sp.]
MSAKPKPGSPFENNPLAQAILREGLLIQDRFSAAPVYAKTGKGYLKSVGVREIEEIKKISKKNGR